MTKNNLRKLYFIFNLILIFLVLFNTFNVQWRGATIVNTLINVDIPLLNPIETTLNNVFSSDLVNLLLPLLYSNIAYLVIIQIPLGLMSWVKELLGGCRK